MFESGTSYPKAVASHDDEGVAAAIEWSLQNLTDDETLTVWTALARNLRNCVQLEHFVNRYSNVQHATSLGHSYVRPGPVIMAWPDMDDIGVVVHNRITSLCVITGDEHSIRPWVFAVNPVILGDGSEWETTTPELDPVVVEALKSMTLSINHSNTISGRGYEKDDVVGLLLLLHDARIPMDPQAMQGWALAHGWSGDNPKHLAKYVSDINSGKRPRTSRDPLKPNYLDVLRARADGREVG